MKDIIIHLLLTAAKTFGSKFIDRQVDRLIDRLNHRKLLFTGTKGMIHYSHYVGQNHVRAGGQKKIYQAQLSLSVFNPDKNPRVLRELNLTVIVDGRHHSFRLYDTKEQCWEENYTLPAHHVSGLSWHAAPEGHGLSMQWGADGIIPIEELDSVGLYLTYLDEHGRRPRVAVDSVKTQRLPKEQIAE
jgi:hypothetical protein